MYIHSYNGLTWIARKSIDITISILMICVRTDDDLIKFSDLCFEMIELTLVYYYHVFLLGQWYYCTLASWTVPLKHNDTIFAMIH